MQRFDWLFKCLRMKKKMFISEVLSRLAVLEQRAADLYAHYASIFRDDSGAHALFLRMKREEEGHRAMVGLQARLVNGTDASVDLLAVDMSGVDAIVQAIEAQLQLHDIDYLSALDFAIMLETTGMESSYRTLLTKQNSDLARLAGALSSGDQEHVKALLRAKETLRLHGKMAR